MRGGMIECRDCHPETLCVELCVSGEGSPGQKILSHGIPHL